MLNRHGLGALQHQPGAIIGLAHLELFVVGERHDSQGEYFVNLGPVKKVAGTLRRDLRIVVKNDRGREQRIALAFFADQDRKRSDVFATRHQAGKRLRRSEQ